MIRSFTTASILCSVTTAFCTLCPAARGENLPPGTYVYLGESVGNVKPRLLMVDADGGIVWQDRAAPRISSSSTRATQQKPLQAKGALSQNSRSLSNTQFSSYDYPTILWKPKPLGGYPSGIAQLATTFEDARYGSGTLKVKLTLMKVPADLYKTHTITLLDRSGFSLGEKKFYNSDLHILPGSGLLREAHGTLSISEADYRRAVDYTVD
ncbi:hypothetical protein KBI23_06350 [bacterium]|nr:hypothetical protein [bacterium]